MLTEHDLIEATAEALRSRFTGVEMTRVAIEAARLELPSAEGFSKRERVRVALEGKSRMRLAEISRDIGRHTQNFHLEEMGLQVLEESTPPITEITRRDVAKCFGDDLSGERNVVGLVGELFPTIGRLADGFVIGKSLAEEIDQHMVRFPGDWDVEYLFDRIGAYRNVYASSSAIRGERIHITNTLGLTIAFRSSVACRGERAAATKPTR